MDNKDSLPKHYSQVINKVKYVELLSSDYTHTNSGGWTLKNLKQINFFIGPNNSGKSRFIRKMYTSSIDSIDYDEFSISYLINSLLDRDQNPAFDRFIRTNRVNQVRLERAKESIFNSNTSDLTLKNFHEKLKSLFSNFFPRADNNTKEKFADSIIESSKRKELFNYIQKFENKHFKKIYIPLLRGLRTLYSEKDVYLNRTLKDYFDNKGEKFDTGSEKSLQIFTGHTLYGDLQNALLGEHKQRQSVREYEDFLSKNFFDGESVTIIPRKYIDPESESPQSNDVIYLKIGEKKERSIFDLGDGLQTLIILTIQAFLEDKPTIFFIEEPEQNLHAGMQRALIDAFRERPQHMYFMTTHSNHFVDQAQEYSDVSLQSVYQEVQGVNEITVVQSSEPNIALLDSLGVRASSVLLANCSIWVEGLTDKLYLRAYMKKYLDELKKENPNKASIYLSYTENLNYIFTEYQGSNVTHWNFDVNLEHNENTNVEYLTKKFMLIADYDISKHKERTDNLRNSLGENFELLEYKEIENYIPEDILIETANFFWNGFKSKGDSTIDFKNINQKKYSVKTKGIGYYLEQCIDKVNLPNDNRSFFDDKRNNSGTIIKKVEFCKKAVSIMDSNTINWSLTPELNALCKKIFTHIHECNQ